jgi:hypothetical protein
MPALQGLLRSLAVVMANLVGGNGYCWRVGLCRYDAYGNTVTAISLGLKIIDFFDRYHQLFTKQAIDRYSQ